MKDRNRFGALVRVTTAAALAAALATGCGSVTVAEDVGPDDASPDATEDATTEDAGHDAAPDEPTEVPPDATDDADADADDTTDSGPAEVVDVEDTESSTTCTPFEFPAVNDTFLAPGDCNGANYQGHLSGVNLGMGPGLFRFVLSPAAAEALLDDRVPEGSLRLQVMGTCPDGSTCPFAPGRLDVRPLRNDWDEGSSPTFEGYTGADWCRREGGNPGPRWAADGASGSGDVDSVSGGLAIDALPRSVSIPFAPVEHRRRFAVAERELSMRVAFEDGTGMLAVHARESDAGLMPVLELTVCE
ncbi:MAG: hypothetical protein JXB32_07030 [Deltaproteobacteria bacterium]|nr:hypothetical protein [Deltaproteobacteria bacterium]